MSALFAFWHDVIQSYPHWMAVVSAFWLSYLLILGAWIVLQKREPIATLSWLLALALLPVIGFVIYHVLGPTRLSRQRQKRLRAKMVLAQQRQQNGVNASALMQLNTKTSGLLPSNLSAFQLIDSGVKTFDALCKAFESARHHIHLEYYIFEPDNTGLMIRDALIKQAKRGIQVRLLLDRLGSNHLNERFLKPLREAGVELLFFHSFAFKRIWRPQVNFRTHRKIVVIDGEIGFTGGVNISDAENEQYCKNYFTDLHATFRGEAVHALQFAFLEDWIYAGGKFQHNDHFWPSLNAGELTAQIIAAGPDTPWEPIHRAMVQAIHSAKSRILLSTPYFVPSDAGLHALQSAALRGVDVRLIVPRRSDNRVATYIARSHFEALSKAGVRVYEFPSMLHSKALLVDGECSFIGSSNFDNRSFRLNFELNVLLENVQVGEQLSQILHSYLKRSHEFNPRARISAWARLCQALARLFSPLL